MKPSRNITEFIKAYESLHDGDLSTIELEPKADPVGIWTEGWGKAMLYKGKYMTTSNYPTLKDIMPYRTIVTLEDADKELKKALEYRGGLVMSRLKVPVSQQEFDALLSHYYNCGYSATMYRLVNSRASANTKEKKEAIEAKIKDWFINHYITAQGVPLRGLKLRRSDEYTIWSEGFYNRIGQIVEDVKEEVPKEEVIDFDELLDRLKKFKNRPV